MKSEKETDIAVDFEEESKVVATLAINIRNVSETAVPPDVAKVGRVVIVDQSKVLGAL